MGLRRILIDAATALRLATPRTIALSGDVTGSAVFDGSQNVTINTISGNAGVPLAIDANQVFENKPNTQSLYSVPILVTGVIRASGVIKEVQ